MSTDTNVPRQLMSGNQALAEGAIQAGCAAYFGYPITPQNEIPEYMARHMPEAGRVFVQSESELAAISMVMGAALTGVRAMTTSSSPGISLMQEGISYLCGCELPAVIANVVRGGPGLGNIAAAQSDYFQAVKGGGHGDYRLFVIAPASVQEMYDFAWWAFDAAFAFRNPAMILSDGLIGQMMEPVVFPEHLKSAPSNKDDWATNGMATRGSDRRNLVKTLYLSPEELNAHNLKLKAKYERMTREEVRSEGYNLEGDYRLLIVSYGTMSRVCRTVIDELKTAGVEVGMVRPQTLFPFPRQAVYAAASKASCRAVLSVEMSMGQMVEDVELSLRGARPVSWYGKCGGEVPTPEEVTAEVRKLIAG